MVVTSVFESMSRPSTSPGLKLGYSPTAFWAGVAASRLFAPYLGARIGEWRLNLVLSAATLACWVAIELVQPGSREPNPQAAAEIAARALAEGVILLTCGTYGNVIRLLPPLVIPDELLVDGLDVLADAVRATAGVLVGAAQ